jgi:hypothetical protein
VLYANLLLSEHFLVQVLAPTAQAGASVDVILATRDGVAAPSAPTTDTRVTPAPSRLALSSGLEEAHVSPLRPPLARADVDLDAHPGLLGVQDLVHSGDHRLFDEGSNLVGVTFVTLDK